MKKALLIIISLLIIGVGVFFGSKYIKSSTTNVAKEELYQLILVSGSDINTWDISTESYELLSTKKYISETLLTNLGYLISDDTEEGIVSLVSYDTLMRYNQEKQSFTYDGIEKEYKNPPIVNADEYFFAEEDFGEGANLGWYVNDQRKVLMALNNKADYSKASLKDKGTLYDQAAETEGIVNATLDTYANLFIGKDIEGWTEVVSEQLIHGYVESSVLSERKTYETILNAKKEFKYSDEPINLTWEAVYSYNPDTDKIPAMKGLNVISPTWMSLADSEGNINKKLISQTYTSWAHSRGYEIWPLISNDFKPERTSAFLKSTSARMNFINTLVTVSLENNFDGINIDFENIFLEDKERLSQFVAELSQALRQNDLTVSMDVTVIGGSDNWSRCYDRAVIGQYVDYLMIMAYDQYWAASPKSGPVAAYDWVSAKMIEIIQVVPEHKLVLGMPTYMRIWKEVPSTEKANTMKAKSSTLSMHRLTGMMDQNDYNFIWDETGQHYYIGYIKDDILYKIWVEDGKSIRAKTAFARDKNLAGVATWRRGFETQDIWGIIEEELNK